MSAIPCTVSEFESNESQPLLSNSAPLEDQTAPVRATPLPKAQFTALCIARLSDPIGFTQIFPHINEFIAFLHVTDDPGKIGFYSGIAESTSAIAAVLTILQWTRISDAIGRRPVILIGALGHIIVHLLFGLSRSFTQIIALRALAGLLSGNTVAYPIYGGIYPLGATIGSLVGRFFSNLATKYPKYFGNNFLQEHPYFPPGVIAACVAMTGFTLTYCFLEETHPAKCGDDSHNTSENPSLTNPMRIWDLISIPGIRAITLSTIGLAFLDIGFTVLFVLFSYTPVEVGGLGFSVVEIGYAMAMSSGIFAFFQFILMPTLLKRFNIPRMYIFCMGLWTPTYLLLPLLNVIAHRGANQATADTHINFDVLLWVGISFVLICWRASRLAYPTNGILVRDNSPNAASLGASIGLNHFAMGLTRCVTPLFISTIFALSVDNHLLGGYLWVVVMTLICSLGYYVSTKVPRDRRIG
ncbi:major facilitator superfamily domain-containing protein [Mycena leptocephala]|nr:major facilitator superfamily domain-containing protein [Mycena leptocephala]